MIKVDLSSLRETKPHEYAIRFLFGGICTVLAGLVAKRFGPAVGGLFLAFPAIFPAGASLIEDHEKKRKAEYGLDGTVRGRLAASIDAAGASLGCIGLMAFAIVIWRGIPGHNAYWVISVASFAWMLLSGTLWALRRKRLFHH
jgi:Protein of unknown function (DUF3147)